MSKEQVLLVNVGNELAFSFNERVLQEATDPTVPLIERAYDFSEYFRATMHLFSSPRTPDERYRIKAKILLAKIRIFY